MFWLTHCRAVKIAHMLFVALPPCAFLGWGCYVCACVRVCVSLPSSCSLLALPPFPPPLPATHLRNIQAGMERGGGNKTEKSVESGGRGRDNGRHMAAAWQLALVVRRVFFLLYFLHQGGVSFPPFVLHACLGAGGLLC